MPLQDDLKGLIHPDTTDTQVIETCKQYGLVIEESQLPDVEKLKELELQFKQRSTHNEEKRQLACILLYRAGEYKYASMFAEGNFNLFAFNSNIENILQLLNPNIPSFQNNRSLEYFAYHTLIAALGTPNILAFPMWLQIMFYKAFHLSAGILNETDYNHESAAAQGFDLENILRLAKTFQTGLAEKEAQEKLALAVFGKIHQTDRSFSYQGQTAEQAITAYKGPESIATAVTSTTDKWFAPYNDLPLALLFKIGNAYKTPQTGIPANAYAAALCYALVLRLKPDHLEAKQELERCFREGTASLPANITAIQRLEAFYAQALAAPADTAATSAADAAAEEFTIISILKSDETTEAARLASLSTRTNQSLFFALEVLGINPKILSSSKFLTPSFAFANGELTILPSILASVLEQIKKQRNEKFKTLKRDVTFLSAVKTAEEFIAVSNKLALEAHCSDPEVYSPASSLYEKIRQYGETIKPSDTVDINAVSQGLSEGIAIVEELDALLVRIRNVKDQLPNTTRNPFDTTSPEPISWFPAEITRLTSLRASNYALIGAIQFLYDKFNEHMQSLRAATEVLSQCLQASERDNYTEEHEKLLEFWYTNQAISWITKIRGFGEDHKTIAQTRPRLEAATLALEKLAPDSDQVTNTKLDTLARVIQGSADKVHSHRQTIALTLRRVTAFIEQEKQAKEHCRSSGITKRLENLSWQDTELQDPINKKADELNTLRSSIASHHTATWQALIEGLRTKNLLGFIPENPYQIYNYLGLPQTLKRTDMLAAMDRLGAELRAFKEIEALINQDNVDLACPANTNNEYTRARNSTLNFNFATPHHFEIQLQLFREIREKEIKAKQEMDSLVSQITSGLDYSAEGLRGFIDQQLQTHTYQESLPILNSWFNDEKAARDFLSPYLPSTSPPTGFVNWLTHLPGAAAILLQIANERINYSETLTTLNRNVQGDYNLIVAEYDQLEAAYRSRYKWSNPSQERLNKITELLTYKNQIVGKPDTQLVEKYALLLGALKNAYDTVLEQHIKGRAGNNNSVTQFFKERVSSSELVEVLEASLSVSAPSIVQHGFFRNTRVMNAPILTRTQGLYTQNVRI